MRNFLQVQGNQRHCAEAYSFTPQSDSAGPCHVFSVIDAEITEKGHLGTETGLCSQHAERLEIPLVVIGAMPSAV
jgi:hypothetical protein